MVKLQARALAMAQHMAAQRLACLRKKRQLSIRMAAAETEIAPSTVDRIEQGRVTPRASTIEALLTVYGVHDPFQRAYVLELAAGRREPAWYDQPHVPLPLAASWHLEDGAEELRTYHVQFIPPLLQTEDYARAVCAVASTHRSRTCPLEFGVGLLHQRRQILERARPPAYWAIIDESALMRNLGGPTVQSRVLDALIQDVKSERITLQIALMDRPIYLPCTGPFTVYRFAQPDRADVVASHSFAVDRLLGETEEVEPHLVAFSAAASYATKPGRDTLDVLFRHRNALAHRLG
ncbi:helix-turn-helix transcriptional regulator [Nonomuraea sp. NPDC049784]|uniref:helix-turn-helix domain-containing protein n=1 Tax=Nonomuraea sp. NPDC049784 TaxID=3154361 RepID=UPI0033FB26B7